MKLTDEQITKLRLYCEDAKKRALASFNARPKWMREAVRRAGKGGRPDNYPKGADRE